MKLSRHYVEEIRCVIRAARATVARGVDLVQVHTNFEIGRRIVEREQHGRGRAAYGHGVIKALADRLTKEFGSGFSERNLASMRTFHLQYRERAPILQSATAKSAEIQNGLTASAKPAKVKILQSAAAKSPDAPLFPATSRHRVETQVSQPMSGQAEFLPAARPFTLSWTHYVFLLGIKNLDERSFYEIEATAQNWGVRDLKRQFNSSLYERLALSPGLRGTSYPGTRIRTSSPTPTGLCPLRPPTSAAPVALCTNSSEIPNR